HVVLQDSSTEKEELDYLEARYSPQSNSTYSIQTSITQFTFTTLMTMTPVLDCCPHGAICEGTLAFFYLNTYTHDLMREAYFQHKIDCSPTMFTVGFYSLIWIRKT
ncbi:hypothetical protein ACJX0J_019893, partial [Zea mays]